MIREWLMPWESNSMIHNPIAMPVFMLIAALLLSIVTWIRQRKSTNNEN